jgi:hypothetical protein
MLASVLPGFDQPDMRFNLLLLASSYLLAVSAQRALHLQKSYPSLPLGLWSALAEEDAARQELNIVQ